MDLHLPVMADRGKCIDALVDHNKRMHAAQALTAMPGHSQGRMSQGPSTLIAQSSLGHIIRAHTTDCATTNYATTNGTTTCVTTVT